MNDFTPSSTSTIYLHLDELGIPVTGATVTVTITNPTGTVLVNGGGVYEEGDGLYSYTLTAAQTATVGTYLVNWAVASPTVLVEKTTFTVGYESTYNLTLLDVRHMIARQVEGAESFYTGVVNSATATTVTDTKRTEPDNGIVGSRAYFYHGTATGQERRITAHDQSTTQFTVSPAFSPTPAANDRYEIHREFAKDDFDSAIRLAYFDVMKFVLVPVLYTGLTVDSNTAEYDIPAGISHVHKVEVRINDLDWRAVAPGLWSVIRTHRKLRLHPNVYYGYSGQPIRVYGLRPPSDPLTDDVGVDVDPNYLVNKAAAYLVFGKIKQPGDVWAGKYQLFESKAERAKLEMNKSIPNNTRRVE